MAINANANTGLNFGNSQLSGVVNDPTNEMAFSQYR